MSAPTPEGSHSPRECLSKAALLLSASLTTTEAHHPNIVRKPRKVPVDDHQRAHRPEFLTLLSAVSLVISLKTTAGAPLSSFHHNNKRSHFRKSFHADKTRPAISSQTSSSVSPHDLRQLTLQSSLTSRHDLQLVTLKVSLASTHDLHFLPCRSVSPAATSCGVQSSIFSATPSLTRSTRTGCVWSGVGQTRTGLV